MSVYTFIYVKSSLKCIWLETESQATLCCTTRTAFFCLYKAYYLYLYVQEMLPLSVSIWKCTLQSGDPLHTTGIVDISSNGFSCPVGSRCIELLAY